MAAPARTAIFHLYGSGNFRRRKAAGRVSTLRAFGGPSCRAIACRPTTVTDVSIRSLVTVAAVVWAVAVLIAVLLGLPMLLTVEGIDIDAGLVISGVAAVGTVGTLTWAVVNGLELRGRADADRREAALIRNETNIEKRLDQARRVSSWSNPFDEELRALFPEFGPNPWAQRVHFSNSSAEAVYEVVVYLVWVQGSATRTGEAIEIHYRGELNQERGGIARMRAIVQVLPPGDYWLNLAGPTNTPPNGRLGVEVAFTDGAGRHWVRRVPTGNLQTLDTAPIDHYGVGRPYGTYARIRRYKPR